MGGEVVWWVVVVVLTCCPGAPPVSLFLLNPLPSPLYPDPHYSPLVGCVTSFVVSCVLAVDSRELVTFGGVSNTDHFDRVHGFICNIVYKSYKIVIIIKY